MLIGKSKIIPFKLISGKLNKQVTFELKDKTISNVCEKTGKVKELKEIRVQK